MTKQCTNCGTEKTLIEFAKNGSFGRHTECKDCQKEKARLFRVHNLEAMKERDRQSYQRNIEKKKASISDYYERNKEKIKLWNRERYQAKTGECKEISARYRANNKEKIYEWNGTRRASIRQALPLWADRGEIRKIYRQAIEKSLNTGIKYHVDHIIPLVHPMVCGLHVPQNLQVIPAIENLKKQNRFM